MSEITVTRTDLIHVEEVVDLCMWLLQEYPEMVSQDEEDEVRIVRQWLTEKLI